MFSQLVVPLDASGSGEETLPFAAGLQAPGMIVVATHGRSGFSHAWMGSVADELLRGTGSPMLLLGPGVEAS